MTDADVFRGMAAAYNEAAQGQESAAGIRALINEANLYTRAAEALDENARLRAAIESVEQLQRWANEMTHYHKGEWVLYADVIAALRKPDAAGGDDAK